MNALLQTLDAIRRASKLDRLVLVLLALAVVGQLCSVVTYGNASVKKALVHVPFFSVSAPMSAGRRITSLFHVGITSHGKLTWHKLGRKEVHRVTFSHRLFINLLFQARDPKNGRTALQIGFCNRGPLAIALGYDDPIDEVIFLSGKKEIPTLIPPVLGKHTRVRCDDR